MLSGTSGMLNKFDQFLEAITLDISVGDTILGGKFKNKKIIIKEIGKNEKGDITINGRPLLKYRILPQQPTGE